MWTEEQVDVLKKMWIRGDSARLISLQLGTTRNAVIGKANRLKLPLHPSRSQDDIAYSENEYFVTDINYEPKICSEEDCNMTAQPGRDYCAYHCRQIIEEQKRIKKAS